MLPDKGGTSETVSVEFTRRVTARFPIGMKVEKTSSDGGKGWRGGTLWAPSRGEREGITTHPVDRRGHRALAHRMVSAHPALPKSRRRDVCGSQISSQRRVERGSGAGMAHWVGRGRARGGDRGSGNTRWGQGTWGKDVRTQLMWAGAGWGQAGCGR
jgi:hypothetical protein